MVKKRHIGILIVVLGVTGAVATFFVDGTSASDFDGIGPLQLRLLLGCILFALTGIPLILNGDRPA